MNGMANMDENAIRMAANIAHRFREYDPDVVLLVIGDALEQSPDDATEALKMAEAFLSEMGGRAQ